MTLISRFWHTLAEVTTWLTLSPLGDWGNPSQIPLTHNRPSSHHEDLKSSTPYGDYPLPPPPIFKPPTTSPSDDHEFLCNYTAMEGWFPCSIENDRECWLRNKNGEEFNIHTNYEKYAPIGIERNYTLVVTNGSWNADGQDFPSAKLFNDQYPGPWIEACWGDTLNIRVVNNMTGNGTSIHWHGIRQNQTMDMDGVNGVTQCPIAPGDEFTYTFKATQYGTSWYHSHYSMQYADGLQGPLTIHGPTSAPFKAAKRPLLMTDWSHVSAYQLLWNRSLGNKTILLNGNGSVAHFGYEPTLETPKNYELYFNRTRTDKPSRPVRYLLRLINTSFDSAFVFSIDNHWLQIVSADFVPIEPYYNTSVLIGIGQRYNVIVEANPLAGDNNPIPDDGNFWIRTWLANNCSSLQPGGKGYEETGILRYDKDSTSKPTSSPWTKISKECSDETYTSLKPKFPWYVGPAANARHVEDYEQFNVTFNLTAGDTPEFVNYPMARFSLQRANESDAEFGPLQIDYHDPTVMHLSESSDDLPKKWVVIPEDYTEDQWIYLVLTMDNTSTFTNAHPIHLHGHDFAILQQEENMYYDPSKFKPQLDNPPRRDVVLLPKGGFVVIAFKADNPGSWLMHCHIARHASEGLALQILERQGDANKLFPKTSPGLIEAKRVCDNWKLWSKKVHPFEGDSDAILEISDSASTQQIRDAYKRAALKTHPDRVASDSPERAQRTRKFQLVNDAYYALSDATRRRDYDSQRRLFKNSTSTADPFAEADDPDESVPPQSAYSWAWNYFTKQTGTGTGTPAPDRTQTENAQFSDVFEEMMREEGLAEDGTNRPTGRFWSMIGGASGGALGFIVANVPGLVAGAVAGNRVGAIRDAKGKSVFAVFQELPQGDRARLLSQLAARVFSHAVGV
ncbi:hypothetical protein G7046_g619 [Stylonectria norvegica]|nr:hypothetical protein G7046_g619 [Stylonectria norvegica]